MLTTIEQLKLTKGEVKPPNHLLIDLVHHVATQNSKNFYNDYKDGFDESANTKAVKYKNKMFQVCDYIFKQNTDTIKSLTRIIIVIIGDSSFTLSQVENADDDAWSVFLLDKMNEAFELLSGVKKDEKTEYNSL